MNPKDDHAIDELIGNVLADDIPDDVARRLRSRVEKLASRLGEVKPSKMHRFPRLSRRAWCGLSATAAAVIGSIALIGWMLLPGVSLADVAAAVFRQSWIHVTGADASGQTSEYWYSPGKDISASRHRDWIQYRDHRLRVYYAYDAKEHLVYRVPEQRRLGQETLATMTASLQVLLQENVPADQLLKRLGFVERQGTPLEVVAQQRQLVHEGGREWLDYHLTVMQREPGQAGPLRARMLFRVEPETKLLRLSRTETEKGSDRSVVEMHFDYPEKGPVDVYDLGAPRTAKLIDRIPGNELSRILETIEAGRDRMDNYRGVCLVGHDIPGLAPSCTTYIIYRKGAKSRRDGLASWNPEMNFYVRWPASCEEVSGWWKKVAGDPKTVFVPTDIQDGSTYWSVHFAADPKGEAVAISDVKKHSNYREFPVAWSFMAEYACRPPLGIPHETLEPVLDMKPGEGPAGSILLRVQNTGLRSQPPCPDKSADTWRYWLDPARDYAVVRFDIVGRDAADKETLDSTVVDEMARSPQGIWYATKIRRVGAVKDSEGNHHDQITRFYLDFNVELPDTLFEPPKPGRVHE